MSDDIFGGLLDLYEDMPASALVGNDGKSSEPTRLEKPPRKRGENNLVGLRNQGATCYLNSLIQVLFMTPELKRGLYELRLAEDLGVTSEDQLNPPEKKAPKEKTGEEAVVDMEQYGDSIETLMMMGVERPLAEFCIRKCPKRDNQEELMNWVFDEKNTAPFYTQQQETTAVVEKSAVSVASEGKSVKSKVKYIPLQLLKLFGWLECGDNDAVSTADLTHSFGWQGRDVSQQHDIHELNRILFDVLSRSLRKTSQEHLIPSLYLGKTVSSLQCQKCGASREREEQFEDLMCPIEDRINLHHSLMSEFGFEDMSGSNQVKCDACGIYTDHEMSKSLRECPAILTLSLRRFNFDFVKGTRYKVSNALPFPLVLDMAAFDSSPQNKESRRTALQRWAEQVFEEKKLAEMKSQKKGNAGGAAAAGRKPPVSAVEPSRPISDHEPAEGVGESAEGISESSSKRQGPKRVTPFEKLEQDRAYLVGTSFVSETPNFYDLFAVVMHRGGAHGGHYHAYIRDVSRIASPAPSLCSDPAETTEGETETEGSGLSGGTQWYDFNDSNVMPIKVTQLLQAFGDKNKSESGYILVYRRRELLGEEGERKIEFPTNLIKSHIDTFNASVQQKRDEYDTWENKIFVKVRVGKDLSVGPDGQIFHPAAQQRYEERMEMERENLATVGVAAIISSHPPQDSTEEEESLLGCLGAELGGDDDYQPPSVEDKVPEAPEGLFVIEADRRWTTVEFREKFCTGVGAGEIKFENIRRIDVITTKSNGSVSFKQNIFNLETDEFTPSLAELGVSNNSEVLLWDSVEIGDRPYSRQLEIFSPHLTNQKVEYNVRVFGTSSTPQTIFISGLSSSSSLLALKLLIEKQTHIPVDSQLICKYDEVGIRMMRGENDTRSLSSLLSGVSTLSVEIYNSIKNRPVSLAVEEYDNQINNIEIKIFAAADPLNVAVVSARRDWTIGELKIASLKALKGDSSAHGKYVVCRAGASGHFAAEDSTLSAASISPDETLKIELVDEIAAHIQISFVFRKLGDKQAVSGTEPRHLLSVPINASIKDAKRQMCQKLSVSDKSHRLRTLNCFGEPLEVISAEARPLSSLAKNFQDVELWLEEGKVAKADTVALTVWVFTAFPSLVTCPEEIWEGARTYTQLSKQLTDALDSTDLDIPLPKQHSQFSIYSPSLFSPKVVRLINAKSVQGGSSDSNVTDDTCFADCDFFSLGFFIECSKEDTLASLKMQLVAHPSLAPPAGHPPPPADQLLVWVDGKLIRNSETSLKKQGVTNDKHIVCQWLPPSSSIPPNIPQSQLLLCVYLRRSDLSSFQFLQSALVSGKGKGLHPEELLIGLTNILAQPVTATSHRVLKYLAFGDTWVKIPLTSDELALHDPDDSKTKTATKAGLRASPWLLRDGDILVVQENEEAKADAFEEEYDPTLPRRLRSSNEKLDPQVMSGGAGWSSGPKTRRAEVGITIDFEDYEEDSDLE